MFGENEEILNTDKNLNVDVFKNKHNQTMESTRNTHKRNKTGNERCDCVEISLQDSNESTNSKLLKVDGDGNEVRISKNTPKRVSFLDDEGQLDILLMSPPGTNEEQICPGTLRTHSTDVHKGQITKEQLLISFGIIIVILALIIVVIVIIKEIQQVLQRQEPEKNGAYEYGKHNYSLYFFFKNNLL